MEVKFIQALTRSTQLFQGEYRNVRNSPHCPHACCVPPGKTEEEINKVIAWGKVSLENVALSLGKINEEG